MTCSEAELRYKKITALCQKFSSAAVVMRAGVFGRGEKKATLGCFWDGCQRCACLCKGQENVIVSGFVFRIVREKLDGDHP